VVVTAGIETSHPEYAAGTSTALNGSAEYYRIVHETHKVKDMRIPCNV
jgi:hypothetical protein